jgi:COP9 signalosome complex subunit 7
MRVDISKKLFFFFFFSFSKMNGIHDAIGDAKRYAFSELLADSEVAALSSSDEVEARQSYARLELFCYGRVCDFDEQKHGSLSDSERRKLQQLTLMSMCAESKVVDYESLLESLQLQNVRQLEDLIIDSIYAGVVKGKLDRRKREFHVELVQGRDVPADSVGSLLAGLRRWQANSHGMLEALDAQIGYSCASHKRHADEQQSFDEHIASVTEALRTRIESDAAMAMQQQQQQRHHAFSLGGGSSSSSSAHQELAALADATFDGMGFGLHGDYES